MTQDEKTQADRQKPGNIREYVWKIIDTDIALKKNLQRNLLNIRSVANYIITEHQIKIPIDAVISAIRRYHSEPAKKIEHSQVYTLLKQAKLGTVTKISALSLKKNEEVHQIIGEMLPKTDFVAGDILRIIEGVKIFRIIFDQKDLEKMQSVFGKRNIVEINKKLGMLELIYPNVLQITPGVFSCISNELASHDISIIDAVICSNEHIIIVDEKNVPKAFDAIFSLCS